MIKKITTILILLILVKFLNAQVPDWENPEVFEINQSPPHTPLLPYTSRKAAMTNNKAGCEYYLTLNGTWKFKWLEKPADIPEGFYRSNFNVKKWDQINVPSNWQMEGFGYPKFRNISLTFPSDPPHVPDFFNPVGLYKRTFSVPSEWNDREVFLHFEGVKSAAYVWINGEKVGYNEGGMEPAEFNVTPFIKKGKNDVTVQVLRYSDGTYLENQDMWRLSGIYREVYLFATPKIHMRDYYVVTDLDENYKDAQLGVDVDLSNYSDQNISDFNVQIDLLDHEQQKIWNTPIKQNVSVNANQSRMVSFQVPVTDPEKWSAESPYLYSLVLELFDDQNNLIEAYSQNVGFREIEVTDRVFKINGRPVKFNGVNSHIHHPELGKTMPVKVIRKDLELMKQFNINCVRTSHYPPDREYLELADEIGIYVVDETGDECHGNIYLSKDPQWKAAFIDRAVKMVYRDRNHPSIVMWSAGNEAGVGDNLRALIEEGKRIDPSRPAWMYGGNTFSIPFEDIVGPRYWIPLEVKKLAEVPVSEDPRPSYMDEYLAATGNSLGGMDEYWELIYKYPRLTGGAIWDWVSPGIKMPLLKVPDRSPFNNDGVIIGRGDMVDGKSGKALLLSGNDEWVELYRDPSLNITGKSLTMEIKVYPLDWWDQNPFITKGDHQFGLVQFHPDSLEFFIYDSKRISANAKVPEDWYNNWHHLAASYDGNELKLFIDGTEAASIDYIGSIRHDAFPANIGRNMQYHDQGEHPGWLCRAYVDDVRIYNKVISLEELKNQNAQEAAKKAVLSLDFDEVNTEGSFYSTGLGGRTYGLIWADRTIQPELWQAKKSAQPVKVEMEDPGKGMVKVTNRHHFTNLDQLNAVWILKEEGEVLQKGELDIELAPGETKSVQVPFKFSSGLESEKEHWLIVSFRLAEDRSWAKKGHEIAFEQFLITSPSSVPLAEASSNSILKLEENERTIEISGDNFKYQWDRNSGQLTSIKVKGEELLSDGPVLNVWRAPLANEIDPWNSYTINNLASTPGLGNSIDNHWRTMGIDQLTHTVDLVEVMTSSSEEVKIKTQVTSYTSNKNGAFTNHFLYTIKGNGELDVFHEVVPSGELPAFLPKLGLTFNMPEQFQNVKWYGRGPFETYPDRKTAAKIDVYEGTVDEQYVDYLIPQDHGNKTDVRWATITNESGTGLMVRSSNQPFNWSVSNYSTENLSRAFYPFQLQKQNQVTVNVDYEVTGVGDTSKLTLLNYRVKPVSYQFNLTLKPVVTTDD